MRNASIGKLRLRPLRKCSAAWKRVKTGDWNPSDAHQTSGVRHITIANLQFDFRTPFPAFPDHWMLDVRCWMLDVSRLRCFAPLLFIRFPAFTIETSLDYKLEPNVLSGDPARCYALATR
jgi:hypothetical protein